MSVRIVQATPKDIDDLVALLQAMSDELEEVAFDSSVVRASVLQALEENVHWFLFKAEKNEIVGTCYLQSVHNYWRLERRFYMGGFYLVPSFRGQGHLRAVYGLLQNWVQDHGGVQIYAHINKGNSHSLGAFGALGLEPCDLLLCVHHWGT